MNVEPRLDADRFREALSYWASGVSIVAFRDDARVIATTVSAFTSLSVDPPLVLFALGANATVLPFLQPGTDFGVSILAREQSRLGSVFADPLPVGPDPFPPEGSPLVRGALVGLGCTVRETLRGGDHTIVIATVRDAVPQDGEPLIRFRRRYHGIAQ